VAMCSCWKTALFSSAWASGRHHRQLSGLSRWLLTSGELEPVIAVQASEPSLVHASRHGHDDGQPRHVRRYPGVVNDMRVWTLRLGSSESELAISEHERGVRHDRGCSRSRRAFNVLTTGGDDWEAEREQWDDGNNVLAVRPVWSSPTNEMSTPTRSSARQASK
jgi:hypothetical protein